MTSNDFTFVLAYQNTDFFRDRNSNFILGYLTSFGYKIILAEQRPISSKPKDSSFHEFWNWYEYNYLHIIHYDDSSFKKSYLYNLASKYAETKYLWFIDCDVFLPIDSIVKQINGQKIIKPFSSVFLLGEQDSENLISNRGFNPQNYKIDTFFSKYSFIIDKDLFESVGGLDESFKGWGWEDLDFCYNKLKGLGVYNCSGVTGYHLYHKKASRNNDRLNYRIFKKNQGSAPLITVCIDWCSHEVDELNFKKLLLNAFLLRDKFNICILLNEKSKNNLSFLHQLKLYSENSFLSVFYSDAIFNKISECQNSLGYLSIGDNFYIPRSLSNIDQNVLINLLKYIEAENANFLQVDDNQDIFCCKNYFDFSSGFNDSFELIMTNPISDFDPNMLYQFELPNKAQFKYLDFDSMKFKDL